MPLCNRYKSASFNVLKRFPRVLSLIEFCFKWCRLPFGASESGFPFFFLLFTFPSPNSDLDVRSCRIHLFVISNTYFFKIQIYGLVIPTAIVFRSILVISGISNRRTLRKSFYRQWQRAGFLYRLHACRNADILTSI